uniref:Uncharacterized protein n=1 Tax=Vespula pensylvanica TaxID=30213 RepID=A0A834PMA1_VESPE|nr:hypothetical protein H0235_002007 [Vespula pensylvanica]
MSCHHEFARVPSEIGTNVYFMLGIGGRAKRILGGVLLRQDMALLGKMRRGARSKSSAWRKFRTSSFPRQFSRWDYEYQESEREREQCAVSVPRVTAGGSVGGLKGFGREYVSTSPTRQSSLWGCVGGGVDANMLVERSLGGVESEREDRR